MVAESEQSGKENILKEILRQRESGESYYSMLGLPTDCSSDDVKRAYKKLSLRVHPDKNKSPKATEVFKIVLEAYAFLQKQKTKEENDKKNQKPKTKEENDKENQKPKTKEENDKENQKPKEPKEQYQHPKNNYSKNGRSSFNPTQHPDSQSETPKTRPDRTKFPGFWNARGRKCQDCGRHVFGVHVPRCAPCELLEDVRRRRRAA